MSDIEESKVVMTQSTEYEECKKSSDHRSVNLPRSVSNHRLLC